MHCFTLITIGCEGGENGFVFWYCYKWTCTDIYPPLNLILDFPHDLPKKPRECSNDSLLAHLELEESSSVEQSVQQFSRFELRSGKWDLWWTKWRWGRFSPSISVSPANLHSIIVSIIIITRGKHNRPFSGRRAEWTQFYPSTMGIKKVLKASGQPNCCWFEFDIVRKYTGTGQSV
jgi:hypothetical protein